MGAIVPRVPSTHGVPPDHGPAAVRLHHHRRAEGRGPASRCRRDRPRLRQPRPPLSRDRGREAGRGGHNTRNHRYSSSRGIPKLREAVADLYRRHLDVELDPETEVINTIGAKEGFSHLMWVLLAARRRRPRAEPVVPDPHLGPALRRRRRPRGAHGHGPGDIESGDDVLREPASTRSAPWPRPRVIVVSFPHNPTTACVDLEFMQRVVDFARRARGHRRARLRLRRVGVRRLRAAVDPAGRTARRSAPSSSTR